ncbi:NINE protein [Azospirillum canadense]|uniref:NINE protein n=1 Tax=Azospirillum canadense TaxID=403962 RepID=UPI002227DAD0|nr:NINE protein [Azospirillum canadense]MCW2243168.1 TM2 domain-containing membrane protein YozV [Azospirillum canadense]
MATLVYTAKSFGTYLLLWLFLGGFGAHKFYLGKVAQGLRYLAITAVSIVFAPLFLVLGICWIVDIVTGRAQVEKANQELAAL